MGNPIPTHASIHSTLFISHTRHHTHTQRHTQTHRCCPHATVATHPHTTACPHATAAQHYASTVTNIRHSKGDLDHHRTGLEGPLCPPTSSPCAAMPLPRIVMLTSLSPSTTAGPPSPPVPGYCRWALTSHDPLSPPAQGPLRPLWPPRCPPLPYTLSIYFNWMEIH
jgi:hypothetical protein